MALKHAQSGEVVDLLCAGQLPTLKSQAIVSAPRIEVMRLVLSAGHAVPGPITIHCLQGAIEVQVDDDWRPLRVNELIYLAEQTRHALRLLADSIVLVTLVRLPPGG
ncbi:hypothetical protein BAY1663_01130 [Pseudomonas sp. BAY1663]|uniref:hypothetical protein n=1 Tax=Pseudomonas sp. BAY1663 TaxID=1439940 RepID=UPI00042DF525|nr:hypothetical protein [Pseudomonas sp. BAY1663]EXF46400.1 hypothetical protein BAY1663_01130 [Pseudomonas sp. BAY1663]